MTAWTVVALVRTREQTFSVFALWSPRYSRWMSDPAAHDLMGNPVPFDRLGLSDAGVMAVLEAQRDEVAVRREREMAKVVAR